VAHQPVVLEAGRLQPLALQGLDGVAPQPQDFHDSPLRPSRASTLERGKLAATTRWLIGALARDTALWTDDVRVVDSTPVECGRSKETARHFDLAGWAEYGYCASHSRYFWGLRLHLLTTLHGCPSGSP
ncbi:MAG TPA: hypothetical protein VEF71_02380, partial [Streptosporangiaceae bacterium]|nr:hypothetical protein [Streptosporangiaceae bacterium]